MKLIVTIAATLLPVAAPTAQLRMDDYAAGMLIEVPQDRPVVELLLPDRAYQTITRADLADVRVFNADGRAVPHAVCASDAALAPLITRAQLSVFEVQAPAPRDSTTRIDVQTARGTQIEIDEVPKSNASPGSASAHVIDARGISGALRALVLDWSSPDGASEARVQIQSSDDLDVWQTIVAGSTLLRVNGGAQQLRRQNVPLPTRRYDYLRVQRVDGGPALRIDRARAEVVAAPVTVEPVWFIPEAAPVTKSATSTYATGRLSPVSYARLLLPQPNSSVRVAIQSRAAEKGSWRTRWSGEFYAIMAEGKRRVSPPAQFASTEDRYWRVLPTQPADPSYEMATLELGYRPAKLRFLAQGAPPFTLAYGSRRTEPAPARSCDRLLADVGTKDLADLITQSTVSAPRSLRGEAAFKPLPQKTPVRLIVLWGVLIAGVGLLIAMAIALFRRLRQSA